MRKNYLLLSCAIALLGLFTTAKVHGQALIIQTIAGNGTGGNAGDGGQATAAQVNSSYGTALDAAGILYSAEQGGNRVRVINTVTGIISSVGTGGALSGPTNVALDNTGSFLIVADAANNRVRRLNIATGVFTTIAGTGFPGFLGDGLAAVSARLSNPRGVAVDGVGNIYVSDAGNQRIRRIDGGTGIITTVVGVGTAGLSGDGGPALSAQLNNPRAIALNAAGNLYIADMTNHRIRFVNLTTNIITTYAGTTMGYAGDGGPAAACQLNGPSGVNIAPTGEVVIGDANNNRIRIVSAGGIITTLVGTGAAGPSNNGVMATDANISGAVAVVYAPTGGGFYLYERGGNRIRMVRPNDRPQFTGASTQNLTVCENSGPNNINGLLAVVDSDRSQSLSWTVALAPTNGTLNLAGVSVSTSGTVTPTGKSYTPNTGYVGMDTFVVRISDGLDSPALDTVIVTVNPLPIPGTLSGPATVCQGADIVIAETVTGGVWSSTTSNANILAGTVTGISAGTTIISYAVTNSCGTLAATHTVTVLPLPNAGTLTGPGSGCVGAATVITESVTGGVWSSSGTFATVTGGIVTGVAVGTEEISYTVTNSCGISMVSHFINILDIPTAGAITGPTNVCVAATITLTNAVTGGAWASMHPTATVSGGLVGGVTAGTATISYTVTNLCGSTTTTYPLTIDPLPVSGTITGVPSVCIGGTTTLSNVITGGVWDAVYPTATVSGGVVTGLAAGTNTITYAVTNVCGTAIASLNIDIIASPDAGVISGPTVVCPGATITLSSTVPGGIWFSGVTGRSTASGGVVTGVAAGTDTIYYAVSYTCGNDTSSYVITVNPSAVPGVISGPSFVCVGSTTTLSSTVTGGVWSSSSSAATITSSSGIAGGALVGATTISYTVTNSCGSQSATHPLLVNAIVTPSVTITATPGLVTCPGVSVTYVPVPTNGGSLPTYQWFLNGTLVSTLSSLSYVPTTGDMISVELTSNASCLSVPVATRSVTATVNPNVLPTVTISSNLGDTICLGSIATYTTTTTYAGTAPSFQWYVNGSLVGIGASYSYAPAHSDVVICSLTSNYPCALPAIVASNSITMTVDVTQTPAISIWANPGNAVCVGQDVNYTASYVYGGLSPFLRWTRNGVNVATGPMYHFIPSHGDVVRCLLASSSPCRTLDTAFSNVITMAVAPPMVPAVTIVAAPGTTIGVGQLATFTAVVTGATAAPTYQWLLNGSAVTGATTAVFTYVGTAAGTAVVNCIAGSGDNCNTTVLSSPVNMTISTVGLPEVAGNNMGLQLLPNPNKGIFTLQGLLPVGAATATLKITDMLGKVVYATELTGSNGALLTEVELASSLTNGVYLLHVQAGDAHEVVRFSLNR